MKIFGVYDHAKEAEDVGLALGHTTAIVFGNPKVGTLLMQADTEVALELPLKVVVFRDGEQTVVTYHTPRAWSGAYALDSKLQVLTKMDNVLVEVCQVATDEPS